MAENKLTEIIQASLEQIKQVVDANTIIGTPITTPNGTTIIPVSKVMVGFASGGLDYLGKNMARKAQNSPQNSGLTTNFGGGGGTGVTVQPVGFLVVGADGHVDLLNVGLATPEADKFESISNLVEKSPEVISKIADKFRKGSDKKAETKDTAKDENNEEKEKDGE